MEGDKNAYRIDRFAAGRQYGRRSRAHRVRYSLPGAGDVMTLTLPAHGVLPAERQKTRTPYAKFRVLLALDGSRLTPLLLTTALARCVQLTDRLDILLVNPPKAPTSMLRGLLLRLEHSGIDYRLASTEGDLGEHVLNYLNRFMGITQVLVDSLPSLEQSMGARLDELQTKGCRFIPLTQA